MWWRRQWGHENTVLSATKYLNSALRIQVIVITYISGSFDFYATNHYSSYLCSPGNNSGSTYDKDMNVKQEFDPTWPTSASNWLRVS